MSGLPTWAKIGLYGAVIAVAVDYFLSPTAKRTLRMR